MTFVINGRGFDPNRIDTQVRLNTVEHWEIVNSHWMDHPFPCPHKLIPGSRQ